MELRFMKIQNYETSEIYNDSEIPAIHTSSEDDLKQKCTDGLRI